MLKGAYCIYTIEDVALLVSVVDLMRLKSRRTQASRTVYSPSSGHLLGGITVLYSTCNF